MNLRMLRMAIVGLAEWLRRLTRNQMGSARTGSNPVADEYFLTISKQFIKV